MTNKNKRDGHDERHPEVVWIAENAGAINSIQLHRRVPESHAGVILDNPVYGEKHVQRQEQIHQPHQFALRRDSRANQEIADDGGHERQPGEQDTAQPDLGGRQLP